MAGKPEERIKTTRRSLLKKSALVTTVGSAGLSGPTAAIGEPEPEEFCQTRTLDSGSTGSAPNCFVTDGMSGPDRTQIIVTFEQVPSSGTVFVSNGPSGSTSCPGDESNSDYSIDAGGRAKITSPYIENPEDELSVTISVENVSYDVEAEECIT